MLSGLYDNGQLFWDITNCPLLERLSINYPKFQHFMVLSSTHNSKHLGNTMATTQQVINTVAQLHININNVVQWPAALWPQQQYQPSADVQDDADWIFSKGINHIQLYPNPPLTTNTHTHTHTHIIHMVHPHYTKTLQTKLTPSNRRDHSQQIMIPCMVCTISLYMQGAGYPSLEEYIHNR